MCFTDTFLFCSQLRSVTMLCFADLHVTLATHLSKTTKETEKNWRVMIVSQEKKFQSPWNWENIQNIINESMIMLSIHDNSPQWSGFLRHSIIQKNGDLGINHGWQFRPYWKDSTELTFTSPDDACWTRSAWCASSTACAALSCKAPKSSTSNKPHCHFRSWFGSLVNQPTCGLYQLYLINSN